ncbi:hypothetical protein FOF46_23450 [Aquimarina algiphila]|uniref:Uncharacterized protein n=2 Tax=Aquimarina algiphila TaxID=2047982 RepID=A0A554VE01_9FLAO|nr:hypothetical protein [Aquimarina algiphila]TSE05222.1 hypothetical protein FOF46_23450 [Aquimarina algiphila]
MFEDNLSYGEACKKLAKLYHVQYQGTKHTAKPTFKKRPLKAKEKEGEYYFKYKKKISDSALKIIGPLMTNEVAERFNLKSVEYFAYVKKEEVVETYATDDYPIFVFDFGDWQKIYQPKSADKSYRFRYAGGRPENFLFGLSDAKAGHTSLLNEEAKKDIDDTTRKSNIKLDQVVLCSGERDALNMASFGYYVVWKNSETAILTKQQYKTLKGLTEDLCNLPDIDFTGVKQAVNLGLQYLDIKTIWLPQYLLKSRDWRGNPKKDFKDFIDLKFNSERPGSFKTILKKLVENALPMKFWDEVPKYDAKGNYKGTEYSYNIVHGEHFLKHQGFYRLETPNEKDEYRYIHIDGNVVKKVTPNKIQYYVNSFLEDRQMNIPLRNMVKKTPYLNESYLSKLPYMDIDFVDCDRNTQYWFFTKYVAEITADTVKIHKKGTIDKMVWEEKVIDFPKELSQRKFEEAFNSPQFKIELDKGEEGDNHDIQILKKDSKFLNYLINVSRIHWRKDLEDSFKGKNPELEKDYFKKHQFDISAPNLNEDEIHEQKLHLINKIFTLGYMLHKYKDKSRAWLALGIDNKLSDIGESHGGSGKTFMYESVNQIMLNSFTIPGRKKEVVESEFIYGGVTKDTDNIFIDDVLPGYDYGRIYTDVSGPMRVNNKGVNAFTLTFPESPKMSATSNFTPRDYNHPSTKRRLVLTVHSDYYHLKKNNEYKQTRTIAHDFGGMQMFIDFTEQDYMDFYAFMAQCVSFFLSTNRKIDPPMNNVMKRNSMAIMGDLFREWAEVYFSPENGLLDAVISRNIAYVAYKDHGGKKGPKSFRDSVEAFCEFKEYIFDPIEEHIPRSSDGRIIKKIDGKTHECFYIKTRLEPINPKDFEEPNHPDYEGDTPY